MRRYGRQPRESIFISANLFYHSKEGQREECLTLLVAGWSRKRNVPVIVIVIASESQQSRDHLHEGSSINHRSYDPPFIRKIVLMVSNL